MKREALIHFGVFVVCFGLVTLFKLPFNTTIVLLWVGGVVGTLVPDLDHLMYAYSLRPHELTSQRVTRLVSEGRVLNAFDLLATTRSERVNLVFHSILLECVFVLLAFWVVSSTASLVGKGMVLAIVVHILVDQAMDIASTGSIKNWFWQIPMPHLFMGERARTTSLTVLGIGVLIFMSFSVFL